jgi:ankyrin repeat protein
MVYMQVAALDAKGLSPLALAAKHGHADVVSFFLEQGIWFAQPN